MPRTALWGSFPRPSPVPIHPSTSTKLTGFGPGDNGDVPGRPATANSSAVPPIRCHVPASTAGRPKKALNSAAESGRISLEGRNLEIRDLDDQNGADGWAQPQWKKALMTLPTAGAVPSAPTKSGGFSWSLRPGPAILRHQAGRRCAVSLDGLAGGNHDRRPGRSVCDRAKVTGMCSTMENPR
jgi:hypothetical protein